MSEKIKNFLLYAGFDKDSYEAIRPKITRLNCIMTVVISAFATTLIFAMYISVFFIASIQTNKVVYEIGVVISALLCLLSLLLAKKDDRFVQPLMMAAYSIFYIYGIIIGCVTSPGEKTVTFMVTLVFLPALFIDRPLHMMLITVFYVVIFIIVCFQVKTGSILENDVIDAIIFGILGISSGTVISHMKVRGYVSEEELKKANAKLEEVNQQLNRVSRTDTLTEMQNRAAYVIDLVKIPSMAKECLGCIYIDANGLKAINDASGHKAGDAMLKLIAEKITKFFGSRLTYRIGGDEFVAFVLDPEFYEIKTRTDEMNAEIEAGGYHISAGWKIHQLDKLSMLALEREAEAFMYQKKAVFYKENPELTRVSNSNKN